MVTIPSVNGKTVFISDAHIKGIDSPVMNTLCAFLDSLKDDTETLVIAGDLFDFWIGCKDVVYYEYLPVLNGLMRLKEKGVRIIYIEGNHDFFMGSFFTQVLKAEVSASEKILSIDGKSIYITHGDRVNKKDYSYRLWRWLLRRQLLRLVLDLIPPHIIFKVGKKLSKTSRRYNKKGFDLNGILKEFARKKWKEGHHGVVIGHIHTPQFVEEEMNGTLRLYVTLGDWEKHLTYLVYDQGRFSLESFNP